MVQGKKKRLCSHCNVLKFKRSFSDGAWVAPPEECICIPCLNKKPILKKELDKKWQLIYKTEQQEI